MGMLDSRRSNVVQLYTMVLLDEATSYVKHVHAESELLLLNKQQGCCTYLCPVWSTASC